MADIQGWKATPYNVDHMTSTSEYLAYELQMQASEWFVVELGFDLKLEKIMEVQTHDYDFGSGSVNNGSAIYPVFASGVNRLASTHKMDSSTGHEIFGTTAAGFVKNYSYPAYAVQCGNWPGFDYYFGIQATYTDGTDKIVHRTWKCTVQYGTRGTDLWNGNTPLTDRAIVHTSHENLLGDSSNRLIAPSSVIKLGMGNIATVNP